MKLNQKTIPEKHLSYCLNNRRFHVKCVCVWGGGGSWGAFNCNYCSNATRNWMGDAIRSYLFPGLFLQDQGRSMIPCDPRKRFIAHIKTRVIPFIFEKQYLKH